MKNINNNTIASIVNNSANILALSIKKARKALGLDPNTSSTPMKKFETKVREVIDVTHVIGKIEVKKAKVAKKIVEVKKESKWGKECAKFSSPLAYLHSCYKKKEIVTSTKKVIVPMKGELVAQRIVTVAGFSARLIKVGKVERPVPTQKKGVATPKRPAQMKRALRFEKGMANLGHFLSLGVTKGERHYKSSSSSIVDINVHIDRIADFLSHGDAITKEGNKIDVVFCNDGIEIFGHAPKETICVDGQNYRWSYECEFISTLIGKLKLMGYKSSGKDGFRTISINPTDKWYDEIRKIITYLTTKTANITVDAVYRAMNVVAGEVKVGLQECSEVTFERRSSLKIKIGGRELLPNDDLSFNNISDLTIGETELSFSYNEDLDNIYVVSNFNSSNEKNLFDIIRGEYIAYCATDAELHHILTTLYYEEIVGVDLQECASLNCNYHILEYVNSQINLQMCGLENYELCTFDKRVINDVPWVTPVLYNENIIIENTEENKSLIKSFSKVESDIKGTYVFLNSRITIDGVEYAAFDLEAKIMGYYFCCNNSQYHGEMLAIKVDEKYACIPKPSSSLKYEENMGVIKFVAQTCKDELMLNKLMMAREYEFLNSPEFIPSLIKISNFGFYSEHEAMYSEWEMPTRASEFLEVANLTTKDMIKYLAPLEFHNTNALALTMLEHCHCVMGNKLAKRLFKVDITTIEGKYEVFNLKWMAVLNALLPISESKTINQWEELFIKSALCPEYNVDNSGTNYIALEYGKMLYNLSGKVIVHCKNDGFNFPARGEICCSLIDKNHIATWYGYGFLMAPNPKAIKALFNRDVWSERIDNGKRKISNYKSIKEHHVVINCSEALRTDWHNEMWVELSETKPVAGFYDKNMCDYENFIELICFCDSVGIQCYEIHDWNNIQRFSFSGDYYSYDHMIEENKELEYVDKYEYIDLQICARTDEIQGVGSYAAHLMVNNGMWADRIESEIHDPSYEECLSVIHCFDWTWGAGANEQNMPTMDSVYRALYQLDALKDMGAGAVANIYSDCVVDCCKAKYIPFTHIYNICINDVVVKEELNAYTEYLMKRHGYVANLSYVTEAILNGAPFSIIAEQAEENGVDVNKFFKWVTKQNINIVGYDMRSYFKEFKLHRSAFYFKKSLDLVDTSIEEIINLLKEVKLHNAQQANEQLNHMQYIESAKKFKVFEAFAYDNSLAETVQSVFNATFKTCNNDYLFNLNETVLAILSHIQGEISLDILHEMASERYSTCFDYYTDFRAVKHAFMAKHGRLPSHICDIVRVMHKYGVSQKCMVELATNYHVRSWKIFNDMINYDSDWSYQIDDDYKIWLHLVFGATIIDIAKKCIKVGKRKETNLMHTFAASIRATAVKYNELKQWYIKNVEANATLLNSIGGMWEVEGFPKYGKSSEMTEFIKKNEAMLEYWECVKQFPNLNWGNFPCEIPMTEVSGAKVLDPNDPVITYVGHLSHCCQTRGGAGQDCMLASMTHPKSSVLYITRDNKGYEEFLAQAWIWEASDSKTLVLDNIEFANNRPIESVFTQLINWLKASPYKMIQLGVGYCEEIAGKFPGVSSANMPGLTNYKGYSDATVSRVWLKKDNKLQGIFAEQNINLQMCASSATCNYSEITLDMETKTINSTIKTIQKIEKNAYPKNMRMMQGKYSKTDIVEYCECESDQLRLFVGSNWYVILAVREYEVEVVDIASIGNMSRAMYSCMIDIIEDNNGLDFVFDARESTSFKFAEKLLSRYGYQTEESNVWDWDGENMHEIRMVKCIDVQMCASDDININMTVTPLPGIGSTNVINGYIGARKVLSFVNSTTVSHFSPKYTEMRGVIVGLEEAIRLGYKQCSFVGISKQTIKWFNGNCPAEEAFIYKAMFEEKAEKIKIVFVNNGIDLQLFADNNTGSSVPEPNGDVRREVQKETSSHKEGVNKMTTNINTSNNNTNKVDCQTSIWHGYDNQDYLVPGMVVLEALRDCRGKLVYRKDHELSPLEVKQMLLNYFRNVPEVNKKSVETEFISHIFTTANSLNYFDAMAKPYEVKLVTVPTTHLKDNNYIIEAAMKDVNKNCLEDIFKAQLIIGSESALAKLKGCKVETYGELLSSMIECDPQNKTMSFVDISSAAKVVARLKSPRNCNEVISKGRHGDKQARVLIVPNSQQAGYTWLDEKFAQDFKLEVTKKYKMTGSDVIFFTENGPVSAAEALDNYKQMGGDLFKGTTAHWNDAIAVIDGREFQNDWDWSVKPEIKRISSRVSKRNGAERIEYSVTIWLKGYTHPVSGCKLRGVVSAKNLMVKGKMTDFSDAIGLKSVVLVGEKIQVAVQGRDGMVKYDAIIPTEAIKFPTFIKNHMGSTFNYVMAEVWDYEENAMVWKECVEGVMELGFESPTGEGRGSYKRVHEKFVQAYGFVQATKGLKGIVPDDVIDGVVSWYEDSIKKNMSTGISLIKGIRGESNVEYKEISLDDFCKLTDGDIIGNETGYCIKSLGGNSELVKPICIPKGKLIYRFFTYCPSDVENFGKDDIVAQMTNAEDPNSIREMKGGLRQLINTLRDINADKSLPLVNEIEEARQRMVADAVEHTKDFFSASFDGGCFTVIYADWLKGDVCGLENSKHKYCSIGRQPYTNFWLNFVEVQDMETISKHSPFKISSRFSKNVVVLPFSKANPTHGDSDGDFAIIKFINDIIAKRWIESGVNSRLEKVFASQFGDPSQRKLNNLLKKVDIRKFFETKTYTYSYDELSHFFAMACQSKANTQTTTSLAYAMGIILGETIAEVNTARNEDSRLQRHIAFNGAFFKLVQDAIDGIKADASTIEIDSIRKIVVAFMQDARNMNMFFGLCNDYKVSTVTTEHQVECINKARGRILSSGHNAEKVYKAIRDVVRITSGKMDYSSIVEYKEGFDKSFNSVNPGVFNKVERFLNAIITKEPTATNYHIALSAKEELNAMGITNEMLQAGNPEAISDKERAKGATYSWISQHISKYANSEAMSCLAWEDKPKEIAKYVCSTEFEKTYEDYNEEGEKVMSRIGRLASLAITIIGGKVSANTGVSGKLFSKLQANASGNKVQDAKFNRVETRRVIGLICLAIALNKGQLRNKDFWYSIGSRLLVNVNGFAALRSIAEKKFAETSKKIQDANQPEAKTITIEDAVAIASTIVTADNGIDLQLFASNPVRSNSKSSKTATTKRERITLKKATRGVVLSELAKLNRHSIERGRGPLPVEVQSWFLEHRMGFDWSIGKCSTREDVHCSYLCKETSTCYYCMIYKHNNCNQIYPATIFPITGEKDYYLAKNTQGYSIINFIK